MVWNAVEMGLQESCFEEAEGLFRVAEAFLNNPVIPMYLGQEILGRPYEIQSEAPKWATLQREALGKLKSVIHFWIRERQAPDGQFVAGATISRCGVAGCHYYWDLKMLNSRALTNA